MQSQGVAGNLLALIYYASPLSTMAEVVRTRNSASILLPMTIMNVANAGLWTTYGVVGAKMLCKCM
jgi:solute carrier family 50 protein (sugar transporter)